ALAWCPWETFKLASGGINAEDTSVKIVDIDKGIVVETFETGGPVVSIIWNEEYKEISTALLNGNNTIKLWKACDFSLVGALGCPSAHQDKIISTVQSWNGTSIASLSCDETICIWKCWPKFSRKQNHEVRTQLRRCLSQAVPDTSAEAAQFPEKIQKIVNDISQLTLFEVAELNKLLKITLNISDVPVMAYGGPAAPKAEEEEEVPAAQVQTAFTVKLMKYDDSKKVALIKEMKNLVEGMNLVQAKKFVESAPAVVKADLSKEEAEKLKDALAAAGAVCEIS
ncbi:hypothetical protein QYM36_007762, partial [Artemia franciscana]